MKKLGLIIVVLSMSFLAACGKSSDEADGTRKLSKKEQIEEYTKADVLKGRIREAELPISDYSTGSYSKNEMNAVEPILTVYVNPIATDEVIDLYVENALVVDGIMGRNDEYLKYIKTNEPYLISFKCLGEEIVKTKVTGNINSESLKDEIKREMEPCRQEAEKEIKDFEKKLSQNKGISCDAAGNYYYVLDTDNISESFEKIRESLDVLTAEYPFEWSETNEFSASKTIMGYFAETYSIYMDEYGGEKYSRVYEPENTEFEFDMNSDNVFATIYRHYIDYTYDTVPGEISVMNKLEGSADGPVKPKSSVNIERDAEFSEDEYATVLYEHYEWLCEEYKKLGINQYDYLEVYINERVSGYEYKRAVLEVDARIPLDRRLTREEFDEELFKEANVFDASQYDEPADCW